MLLQQPWPQEAYHTFEFEVGMHQLAGQIPNKLLRNWLKRELVEHVLVMMVYRFPDTINLYSKPKKHENV
jgi:hypothetical protein